MYVFCVCVCFALSIVAAKNKAWNGVLQYDLPACRRRFRQCECDVKKAVAKAKEDWIQRISQAVMLIVVDMASGSVSSSFRWFISVDSAVLDNNDHLLSDTDAVTAHWCRHFTEVLNVTSVFSPVEQ